MTGPLIKINEDFNRGDQRRAYREFWSVMYPIVALVVESSFMHPSTGMKTDPTQAEIKERTDVCKKLVDTMRNDLGWSQVRIKDNLALALRTKLSGLVVDLDALAKRGSW